MPTRQFEKLTFDRATEFMQILMGLGYACSIKHIGGHIMIEVPVRLKGDPCYGKETMVTTLAVTSGLEAVQAGNVLRIRGL